MTETNADGTLCKQTATLNELRINEGIFLYIEEKMTQEELKAKSYYYINSRWENEFDIEKNSYNIRYNKIQIGQ